MYVKICKMKIILIISTMFSLLCFPVKSLPQTIDICCASYARGMFKFSIVNNSDSTIKLTFEHIQRKGDVALLKSYQLSDDTLSVKLSENEVPKPINASGPIDYYIDGEPYFQKTILPNGRLKLAIKNRYINKRIKYIKITKSDGHVFVKREI